MKHYTMVGAGGTGSALFRPLMAYLGSHHAAEEWELCVIDGDIVESKNLERQLFDPTYVTVNKAVALSDSMGCTNGNVYAVAEYLGEDNIAKQIADGDTVFICVDNFTVRKRIEMHCATLDNVTVINGGNEKYDGSVQTWIRRDGKDITPWLSFLHPEVMMGEGDDRAEMTCAAAAALPGGEQTIIANLQSATWMLTALFRAHLDLHYTKDAPHEIQFDAMKPEVSFIDYRGTKAWSARG